MNQTERYLTVMGWRTRVVIQMKRARVVVKAEPRALEDVRAWFQSTLAPGMQLVVGRIGLWDRVRMGSKRVKIELRGLAALQALSVRPYAPVVSIRQGHRLSLRKVEHIDHLSHKAI